VGPDFPPGITRSLLCGAVATEFHRLESRIGWMSVIALSTPTIRRGEEDRHMMECPCQTKYENN
jgi:hypothetical protein